MISRILMSAAGNAGAFFTRVDSVRYNDLTQDSAGNIYVAAHGPVGANSMEIAETSYGLLVKYNPYGTLLWQRQLANGSTSGVIFFGVDVDAAGDYVYVVGELAVVSAPNLAFIAKYSSSGILQWQKTYGTSNSFKSVQVGTDGGIYVGGSGTQMVKFDTTGAIIWQKYNGSARITLDSDNNIYGDTAKYNSSGGLVWRYVSSTVGQDDRFVENTCLAASGNIYTIDLGSDNGTAVNHQVLCKYNSSGVIQWSRRINNDAVYLLTGGVCVDSAENVYAVGSAGAASKTVIIKVSSAGDIQWQRCIAESALYHRVNMLMGLDGSLLISTGMGFGRVVKLPADGSGIRKYGTINYQSAAQTVTEITTTQTSDSTATGNNSYTVSNAALPEITATFTHYLIT